jgi:hypothetical protein
VGSRAGQGRTSNWFWVSLAVCLALGARCFALSTALEALSTPDLRKERGFDLRKGMSSCWPRRAVGWDLGAAFGVSGLGPQILDLGPKCEGGGLSIKPE